MQLFDIPVWHSSLADKHAHELERIQKRAVKTILGHEESLSACNIDSLARRTAQCLKFAESFADNIRCKHSDSSYPFFCVMVKIFGIPTQLPNYEPERLVFRIARYLILSIFSTQKTIDLFSYGIMVSTFLIMLTVQ